MTEEEEAKLKIVPEPDATQASEGEAEEAPVAPEQPIEQQPEPEPEQEPEVPAPEPEPEPQPRMFSQEEVNALLGKTRMEARQRAREEYAAELRNRYGLESDAEFDDMVGNGQRFEALNGEYDSLNATVGDLKAENALLKSGIPEEKFDDVKAILAYKHLDVTPENIAVEAATHPEWKGVMEEKPQPPQPIPPQRQPQGRPAPNVVPKFGGEPQGRPAPSEDEQKAAIMKMFGRQ